nr:hypothetical protein [Tanacetum cinerariifolium]
MILESVEQGPLLWPTFEEDGVTRLKKYSKLSAAKAIKPIVMIKQQISFCKDFLWTFMLWSERECKLYDEFDKFTYQKGETLHDFYLRFSLILNDMNMYNMKLEQFQVNTKFLNTLPPEWNPLALVSQHQLHRPTYQHHQQSYHQPQFQQQASTSQTSPYATSYHTPQFVSQGPSSSTHLISYPVTNTSSLVNHNAYMTSSLAPLINYALMVHQSSEYSPPEIGLVVSVFQKWDDLIDVINHMMSFLTVVVTSRYPATNNQLRTSSNPRQQATINNGRVTIQPIQGRQSSMSADKRKIRKGQNQDKTGQKREANYDPKGERFLIVSRFPTPPFACAFFSPGATVTALYTGDFCCSKWNVEDKILVPKLPKKCARCGHPLSIAQNKIMEQMTTLTSMCEMVCQIVQKKQEEKQIEEEQAANARYWKILACCDDDDDYNSAITPVLSTEEPDNYLSMGDDHLDTIPATESDEVIKSSVEDLLPIPSESEGIPDTMCDVYLVNNPTPVEAKDHFEIALNSNDDISSSDDDSLYKENIEYVEASPHNSELVSLEAAEIVIPKVKEIKDDNLCEKLLNVHLLIANIEALKDNPTQSFEFLTKSSSTSQISSGSTTTDSDISLSDYEFFYFHEDHIEVISSGSTTTHSCVSLSEYDSFIFNLTNDRFPPTDRSDFTHEEFTDELAHIISPLEYDCFYIRNLPDPGELISILNSGIRKNPPSTTRVNLPIEDDHSPLLAYVVWIFLAYLTYPVIPPYLYSFGNEDTIFALGITINHVYSFKPGLSHRCGAFKKFNTHRSHLNEWPMIINGKNTSILDVLLFHFYPP